MRNQKLQVSGNRRINLTALSFNLSQGPFFPKLTVVFTLKLLCDAVEYFVYYDFYFFKNIDYVRDGQIVSYYLEFARIAKRTMVFALGKRVIGRHAARLGFRI